MRGAEGYPLVGPVCRIDGRPVISILHIRLVEVHIFEVASSKSNAPQICFAELYSLECAILPEGTPNLRKGKIDVGEGDSVQSLATFDPLDPITPRERSGRPRNLVQDYWGWELESSQIGEAVDDR